MQLAGPDMDRTLEYTPIWGKPGMCRLRVWFDQHVAVVTELSVNPGLSVTNAIETVADLIHGIVDDKDDGFWRLVEHYNADSYEQRIDRTRIPVYSEVTFLGRSNHGQPTQAMWTPLTEDLEWLPALLDPIKETA